MPCVHLKPLSVRGDVRVLVCMSSPGSQCLLSKYSAQKMKLFISTDRKMCCLTALVGSGAFRYGTKVLYLLIRIVDIACLLLYFKCIYCVYIGVNVNMNTLCI